MTRFFHLKDEQAFGVCAMGTHVQEYILYAHAGWGLGTIGPSQQLQLASVHVPFDTVPIQQAPQCLSQAACAIWSAFEHSAIVKQFASTNGPGHSPPGPFPSVSGVITTSAFRPLSLMARLTPTADRIIARICRADFLMLPLLLHSVASFDARETSRHATAARRRRRVQALP